MLTGQPVRPADAESREVLLDLVDRLERETDRRAERELAHEIARHGVAGIEERVLRAFPRVASSRARDTLRHALREVGHPSVRPPRRRLASPSRRARRIAASFCLALGAAWLTVALLAGIRGDWAAFAVATLVFFAVVAIFGSYLGRDRRPEEEPAGPSGPAGEVARGAAD